jgi:hypothetical protein
MNGLLYAEARPDPGGSPAGACRIEMADRLTAIFKRLGYNYKYVALDLEGYRQGSLNEALPDFGVQPAGKRE